MGVSWGHVINDTLLLQRILCSEYYLLNYAKIVRLEHKGLTLKRFEALFSSNAGIEALARHAHMQSLPQFAVPEHQQILKDNQVDIVHCIF